MGKTKGKNKKKEEATTLRRKTLNSKYAQQYPFRKIVRKVSGKSLVNAQRQWRDGTALFDRLGLPVIFKLEELDELLEHTDIKEKKAIFELCGKGILTEPKAADPDVTDIFLLNSLYVSGVKCETYYADVVYAFCNQFFYLNNLYKNRQKTVQNIQNGFKRALGKSTDPRILVLQASFLIIYESNMPNNTESPYQGSIDTLKLAIESFEHRMVNFDDEFLEGSSRFDVYYTLATVLNKRLSIMLTNTKILRKITSEDVTKCSKDYKLCLDLFLEKAPICHWNVPSACCMLSTEWFRRKTPPTGAKVIEIFKRNRTDVENSIKLFDKAIESQKILVKWNPHEALETKGEYLEALELQKLMKEEGFRTTELPEVPKSKVEMREILDEDNLSWSEWFKWNLTDSRNVQLVYLFLFFGILLDPVLNIFGFFIEK